MNISKAVIPAAGLGTRFLPFTKAIPKEMLPIINKPSIQKGFFSQIICFIEFLKVERPVFKSTFLKSEKYNFALGKLKLLEYKAKLAIFLASGPIFLL